VTLAPGETRTLRLEIAPRALASFDPEKRAWRAEPGEFELRAGRSSRDLCARARFSLRDA